MKLREKLLTVQTKLNAPKSRTNTFGNYNYRSCEDILEAVKPLLKEVKASITLNDHVECIGDRYYVVAQAKFFDVEGDDDLIIAEAYAREEGDKKGTTAAQLTGATSSYARKYALGALLLVDDQKDFDTDEYKAETDAKAEKVDQKAKAAKKAPTKAVEADDTTSLDQFVNDGQIKALEKLLTEAEVPVEKFNSIYGLAVLSELPVTKYDEAVGKLEKAVEVKNNKKVEK